MQEIVIACRKEKLISAKISYDTMPLTLNIKVLNIVKEMKTVSQENVLS